MELITGNIELRISSNTSAELTSSAITRNISFSNLILNDQVSSPTSLTGTLGAGEGTIRLSVITGNITLMGI